MEQVLKELYASELNAKASELPPAANQRQNGDPTDASHALESSTGFAEIEEDHGAAHEAALSAFSALLSDVPDPTPNSMRRRVPGAEHIAWPWQAEVDDFPEEASVWLRSNDGKRWRERGEYTYAFVLSPCCRQHELRGRIAAHVYQRLSELAYERGWRLEGISVRPNYLRFTAALPDSESGSLMLQTIRQELSNSLFRTFSDLAKSRQGEDFWAADFLRSESGQPLLAQELRQYLQRAGRWLTEPVYAAGSQDSDR
jgi:REP element-mobilizing transposase RayT